MDIMADHFWTLQNPKINAMFLSAEQIYTRGGFTEYLHGGQHCIGQKNSYRFASNFPLLRGLLVSLDISEWATKQQGTLGPKVVDNCT